jgi:hypothetical protein
MKAICAQCGTENTTGATTCTHCHGALPVTTPAQPSDTDMPPRMLIAILGMIFAPFLLLLIGLIALRLMHVRPY